jgi:DNA polymerase-4
LPGVGPKFQERLARLGWRSVEDVAALDEAALVRAVGARAGGWLYQRVRGIDASPVRARGRAKSISRDETFARDLTGDLELEREMLRLVDRAASDLRRAGLAARTVTVRLRDADWVTRQASRTVRQPVTTDRAIAPIARELLASLRRKRRVAARLVGVALSQFDATEQMELLAVDGEPVEGERDRRVARAVDQVRARFGRSAITPAVLAPGVIAPGVIADPRATSRRVK